MLKSAAPGLCALAFLMTLGAAGAEDRPLAGTWTTASRNSTIEIADCPQTAGALCATVIADKPAAGEPSLAGKLVGVNFIPAKGGWTGQVLAEEGNALPATITLPNAARLDLKVCVMAMFCDETSYYRVGS